MIKRNRILIVVTVALLIIFIGEMTYHAYNASAQIVTTNVYLPVAINRFPSQSVFAMEVSGAPTASMEEFKASGASWIRHNGLKWSKVEPTEGTRDWSVLADLEQALIETSHSGVETILIVRSTPTWAQKLPGIYCGPILEEKFASFGQFMYDVVARYSQPPYNVKYWEIWNEPDAPYSLEQPNSPYGCWGDNNDAYYGGGYYALMLQAVYPMIKAADPDAQVLIGGLLLDCDPRPGSNYCTEYGHDKRSPKFLEGILLNNGQNYFDGISFHAYDYFYYPDPQVGHYSNVLWGSSWDTTGPVSLTKADFLLSVLAEYNVTGKFLMNTESALICGDSLASPGGAGCESDPTSPFEQTKAMYVTISNAAAMTIDLRANVWFTLWGWRNSGLLNPDGTSRPAFTAYQFGRDELSDAVFQRQVDDYLGVRIYEYWHHDHYIWLVWSMDGAAHSITLPFTPLETYDHLGTVLPNNSFQTITVAPLFFEWK